MNPTRRKRRARDEKLFTASDRCRSMFGRSLFFMVAVEPVAVLISRSSVSIAVNHFKFQAGPVAQSVERWTPYGGSICPGFKSPGLEARRTPDVYRASWRVWLWLVAGRSQSKSAIGTGRARLCAYVKLSTLNSAIDPELRDRKVEDRANATSSA